MEANQESVGKILYRTVLLLQEFIDKLAIVNGKAQARKNRKLEDEIVDIGAAVLGTAKMLDRSIPVDYRVTHKNIVSYVASKYDNNAPDYRMKEVILNIYNAFDNQIKYLCSRGLPLLNEAITDEDKYMEDDINEIFYFNNPDVTIQKTEKIMKRLGEIKEVLIKEMQDPNNR